MPQKNGKVKLGIVEWGVTHVHFILPKNVAEEYNYGIDTLCFILDDRQICTAPPVDFKNADYYKTFNTPEELMAYINNFARRVQRARERGLLPASWRWIQRHVRP